MCVCVCIYVSINVSHGLTRHQNESLTYPELERTLAKLRWNSSEVSTPLFPGFRITNRYV